MNPGVVNFEAADAALRHLASWGLVGGPAEPIDLTGVDGVALLAEQHRVTGVVLAALDDGAATGVPDELIDDLADRHLRLLQQSLMAEADLVFVARLFQDAGIEFRVLKGLATAHLDYPDPALRLTGDVDVLVRRGQLDAATEVLGPYVDWEQSYPDRVRRWVQRYGKDRTLQAAQRQLDRPASDARSAATGAWRSTTTQFFDGGDLRDRRTPAAGIVNGAPAAASAPRGLHAGGRIRRFALCRILAWTT